MVDKGANPNVVAYGGTTRFANFDLGHLSNLPSQKSIYFTTRAFEGEFKDTANFPEPWFYKTGVFDGKFDKFIGQGATGTVLSGEWFGKKAAFKFVEIGTQQWQEVVTNALKRLDEKLSEMISIQSTVGSQIVKFHGHYR